MIALDWVEGKGVYPLIRSIERWPGPRRTRLLAVAFCDRIAHLLQHDICREWIEVARRYADKKSRRSDLAKAHARADDAYTRFGSPTPWRGMSINCALRAIVNTLHPTQRYYAQVVATAAAEAVSYADNDGADPIPYGPDHAAFAAESAYQLRLLRDVLGRPDDLPTEDISLSLCWQGGLVPKLARGIYEDRTFDQLPVLGDALEDAGCMREDLLAHCRGVGPHSRGCWVVDLVLGKQ